MLKIYILTFPLLLKKLNCMRKSELGNTLTFFAFAIVPESLLVVAL